MNGMSDEEARQFGELVMSFGKYKGRPIKELPLEYLAHLAAFGKQMDAYLKSDLISH